MTGGMLAQQFDTLRVIEIARAASKPTSAAHVLHPALCTGRGVTVARPGRSGALPLIDRQGRVDRHDRVDGQGRDRSITHTLVLPCRLSLVSAEPTREAFLVAGHAANVVVAHWLLIT
jgi:hypothetical protein